MTRTIFRLSVMLVFITAMSVSAFGQKNKPAPAPHAAPSQHSAPAQHAAPAHAAPAQHTAPGSAAHTGMPGRTTQTHTTAGAAGHTTAAKPGTTGAKPGTTGAHTTTAAKPGTTGAKPGAAAGAKPGGAAGAHTTATKPGGAAGAHAAAKAPAGKTVALKGGGKANVRPNGSVRSVDKNGMHIERGVHGNRTVVREHNGARVVTTGRHGGYVQRAYVSRGGHSYYSRTYYRNGVYHSGVYRGYYYGGYHYYGYYNPYYYGPAYYGWAYNPWPGPGIAWGVGAWGWGGAPWYGYYGGYFAPYPVYPSAAFWLTDYLISANLQAAYAAQAEANASAAANANAAAANANAAAANANNAAAGDASADNGGGQASGGGQVALSPEVKQAIAEEVKAELAAQQAQASKGGASSGGAAASGAAAGGAEAQEVPPALDPARRTFVVSSDLTVVADGNECSLTQGDVITRLTDTPDADQKVNASVSASKKSDCGAGKVVAVSVDDLQEMHNHFQESLDAGMKSLAEKQGTNGMPKSPDTKTTASDIQAPPPDTSAGKTIDQQNSDADQAETEAKQDASASNSGGK